jgi:riboflavin transporter FmnP
MKMDVNKISKMGVLSALAIVLMYLIRFPLIPSAPFLIYEPADVPILIGAFLYGPVSGLIITVVVSVIQALTASADGWVGAVMHIIATGAFVIVAGIIYKNVHTLKGAIIALVSGSITMTLVMIPLNLFITSKFLNVPVEVVKSMLIPAIIPFNILKAGINSIITAAVYKAAGKILRAENTASLKRV